MPLAPPEAQVAGSFLMTATIGPVSITPQIRFAREHAGTGEAADRFRRQSCQIRALVAQQVCFQGGAKNFADRRDPVLGHAIA